MFIIFIITIFILGVSIGSFLNVLINRLAEQKNITGRSICPKCNKQLRWYDLIPIFSFIFLKGKCRYCKNKISIQYILVESITGILMVLVAFLQFNNNFIFDNRNILILVRNIIFIIAFISIFVYDIKYMEIPDEIVIPSSVLIFILNFIISKDITTFLIGGCAGLLFFLLQFVFSKGAWIGGGDIRIGFLVGVSFGNIYYVFFVIFFGYILGSIYSIPLLIQKYSKKNKNIDNKVPLGPFLSLSSILTLIAIMLKLIKL